MVLMYAMLHILIFIENNEYILIDSVERTITEYQDIITESGTYYYYVTSVDDSDFGNS